jgi:glutamine amidotransferase
LQLLFERSEEDDTRCLGLLPGSIRQFDRSKLKVPHIGWNQVCDVGLPLFADFPPGSTFYFVHSFYAEADAAYTRATTEYGVTFASMVARDNYWGVQFHPERSGELGLALLKGFLEARF